jgi:Mce-associated membrane protein
MWPRTLTGALAAFVLLTGGSASAERQPDNLAFVDAAETASAVATATSALAEVLSYHYQKLDENAELVKANSTEKFVAAHTEQVDQARGTINRQELEVVTAVVGVGVRDLRADTARLLVFLDQKTTRGDNDRTTVAGSAVVVELRLVDKVWKLDNVSGAVQ